MTVWLKLIGQLLPLILQFVKLFIKSDGEKARDKLTQIHNAIQKAKKTKGDTSDLEEVLKKK